MGTEGRPAGLTDNTHFNIPLPVEPVGDNKTTDLHFSQLSFSFVKSHISADAYEAPFSMHTIYHICRATSHPHVSLFHVLSALLWL